MTMFRFPRDGGWRLWRPEGLRRGIGAEPWCMHFGPNVVGIRPLHTYLLGIAIRWTDGALAISVLEITHAPDAPPTMGRRGRWL